jgi:iron(III) transport system permease protein
MTVLKVRTTAAPTSPGARTHVRRRPAPFTVLGWVVTIAAILTLGYLIIRMLGELLWPDGRFDVSSFADFTRVPGVVSSIRDTTLVVVISGTLAVLIGGGLALIDERTDARLGAITGLMPYLPFLIPGIAGAIGWTLLLSPKAGYLNVVLRGLLGHFGVRLGSGPLNIYSYPGLIFLYTIYLVPFAFLTISAGLRRFDPQLEEQSRVSGASWARTLRKVIVPAIAPNVAGAFLLVTWFGFGMYSVPVTIAPSAGIQIVAVNIVSLLSTTYPPAYGAAISLSLVAVTIIGVAWYLQSRVLRRSRELAVAGRSTGGRRIRLGAWKRPVRVMILGYVAAVTVLPVAALVLVGLSGYWSSDISWRRLSFRPFYQAVFGDPTTLTALIDSLELAVTTATAAIVLAAVVSVTVARSRRRFAKIADGTLKLPAIVSHVILAVGFVLAFGGAPLYLGGTWLVLFITYLALYMPQATLYTDAAAVQVGADLQEASAVSGAGGLRTFRRVFLPLMLPGTASGWALVFIFVLGDLEVSSLLAGPNNPTIGSQTLTYFGQGSFADVAALALLLSIITSTVVFTVLRVARHRSRHFNPTASGVPALGPRGAATEPATQPATQPTEHDATEDAADARA